MLEKTKEKIRNKLLNKKYDKIICEYCGKKFSKFGIKNHIEIIHLKNRNHPMLNHIGWNKGLTKETDDRVKNIGIKISNNFKLGKIKPSHFGKHLSEKHKKQISNSMKKAHKEGRAWNIGKSRWNNESSYPEKFFIEVIETEFNDKNYIKEYPISIWSYDFAWPNKKKCIEIDGEQHEKFDEYKKRDIKKDNYAKLLGWQILRIKWKDMFNDSKKYIQISKEFIEKI